MNEEFGARDIDKRTTSETQHNLPDVAWCILDPHSDADTGGIYQ